jgi:hypothetical protein
VENISYSDITLSNVHPAISMVAYYQNSTNDKYPKGDKPQPMTDTTPLFRNIRISNVTGNSTTDAGLIVGLPESLVQNVTIENVKISAKRGLILANTKGVALKNVQLTVEAGEPIIKDNAEVTIDSEAK